MYVHVDDLLIAGELVCVLGQLKEEQLNAKFKKQSWGGRYGAGCSRFVYLCKTHTTRSAATFQHDCFAFFLYFATAVK